MSNWRARYSRSQGRYYIYEPGKLEASLKVASGDKTDQERILKIVLDALNKSKTNENKKFYTSGMPGEDTSSA